MKTKLLLPFLTALVLTGCSNDDAPDNNSGEAIEYGYVAVNIVQPKSVGGRAGDTTPTASDGFEYGDNAENIAAEGLFFIFNENGTEMIGTAQRVNLTPDPDNNKGNNPEVEKIYSAVLMIDGSKTDPSANAKQIVCVLNAPAGLENGISTLSGLRGKIGEYGAHTSGNFIMSNSVYYYQETGSTTYTEALGAKITADKIKPSAPEAINSPVEIFVERIVAKVRVSKSATFNNKGAGKTETATADAGTGTDTGAGTGSNTDTNQQILVDGKNKTFDIKITGVTIANVAQKSHLFKNFTLESTTETFAPADYSWAWDATNNRSYWEITPIAENSYNNKSYNQIAPSTFDWNNFSFSPEYIQPNTDDNQNTAVLVTAKLLEKGTQTAANLVYIRGGYTTNEGAFNIIAGNPLAQSIYFKAKAPADGSTPTTGDQFASTDLEWTKKMPDPNDATKDIYIPWIEDYEVVAKLKTTLPDGYSIYKKTADGTIAKATAEEVNAILRDDTTKNPLYKARVWEDGMCYYFVNIDQSPLSGEAAHTYDGVIRNHIYDLTLNSISGVGVPVFDPEKIIIPQTPSNENLFFVAATVKVLAWKVVSQGVDLK